jgi:hypothetical protein
MIATLIIIVLAFGDLFFTLAKHGQPKTGRYNFATSLIVVAIQFLLFYAAGLFDKFNL